MGFVPPEVMAKELDLFWQNIFTFGSWGIVVVMLVIAVRMGLAQRTPFYLFAILAACLGAFAEPLYDVGFDLWFYDVHEGEPGAMFSHFTAFGIVQPWWSHSGYVILYATACLYAGRRMYEGRMTPQLLFIIWGAEIFASCVFEGIGTGVGVYEYFGPHVLRLWNYPIVIGVLEGTQTILFTVMAVHLWRRLPSTVGLLGLFVLFPVTMLGGNFGLGWPIVIALHLSPAEFSMGLVWAGTLISIAFCGIAVYALTKFLPQQPVTAR
jgi:hypothetical protein